MNAFQSIDVLFERQFECHDSLGNVYEVKLVMSKAEEIEPYVWRCGFKIVGIGHEEIRIVDGVDAIDALLRSLRMAHALLVHFAKEELKEIAWYDRDDLGLPPL
jgi:hypothetical protein